MSSLEIGARLGPYEILAPIGAGGMGEVWKARDTRLGRIVAIKTVKGQHSERFKQEARSIAALNHPNICQLFDIGDDYLVLEYVEGKSLSSPLPEREAVRISIQIAAALEAAHKKGIIHRDLKPENIMVTSEGSVKLLDFGLAKLYEQSSMSSTAEFPATQAGVVLGTVAYMSPEQAQGQPADARSDIFSFGLVLYEMLSGRKAFSSESPVTTALAIVKDDALPLQASPSIEKIVQRCLAKQPTGRYQTMSEVKTALEHLFAEEPTVAAKETQPSIAVLPFVNMSGDKEQEYFSDGLAEEIINALTQIPGLKVIARTSSFSFRGKEQDIRRIAETLNVNSILEGSVRRSGNRIRVTAQLITADDGSHLWSERYDRDMTDVFDIQDEISQAIAARLRVRLSGDRPIVKPYIGNVDAYNLYLKGRYHSLKITEEGLEKGKVFYEQAISIYPRCAAALSGLASYYQLMGTIGRIPLKEANAHCHEIARRAISVDESEPAPHMILAIDLVFRHDWKSAEQEFRRALELAPESTDALRHYAFYYLLPMRRLDEAIALQKKAMDLDPLLPVLNWNMAATYTMTRQWDLALAHCRSTLELDPNYWLAHMFLGIIRGLIPVGKPEEWIESCETGAHLANRTSFALGLLGWAYARFGLFDGARRILKELEDLARNTYVLPGAFARVLVGLGENDRALDWMEIAAEDFDPSMSNSHLYPFYDSLRSHPRYRALLRKMNLEV